MPGPFFLPSISAVLFAVPAENTELGKEALCSSLGLSAIPLTFISVVLMILFLVSGSPAPPFWHRVRGIDWDADAAFNV